MSDWTKTTRERFNVVWQGSAEIKCDTIESAVDYIDRAVKHGQRVDDYAIERQRVITIVSDPEPVALPEQLLATARAIELQRDEHMTRRAQLTR